MAVTAIPTRMVPFRLTERDIDGLDEIARAHDLRDGVRSELSRAAALRWLIAEELERLPVSRSAD